MIWKKFLGDIRDQSWSNSISSKTGDCSVLIDDILKSYSISAVLLICVCMAVLLLRIFSRTQKTKLRIRELLPSLIFISLQAIIAQFWFLIDTIWRLLRYFNAFDSDWKTFGRCLVYALESVADFRNYNGIIFLLAWILFIIFGVLAMPMVLQVIPLRIHAKNFVVVLAALPLFIPTASIIADGLTVLFPIKILSDNIMLIKVISVLLIPVMYIILAAMDVVIKGGLVYLCAFLSYFLGQNHYSSLDERHNDLNHVFKETSGTFVESHAKADLHHGLSDVP